MIGIDIVENRRFNRIRKNDFKNWKKIFTSVEWDYCFKFKNFYQRMAGTFAAKESTMKALGGRYLGRFDLIEITHDESGKPFVSTNGEKNEKIEISISHEKKYSVAVALINQKYKDSL